MSKHPATEIRETVETSIPTNPELLKGIEATKQAVQEEVSKRPLGTAEYKTAKDVSAVLESTQKFIEEKNRGEVVQKFFVDAGSAADELAERMRQLYICTPSLKPGIPQDLSVVAQQNVEWMKSLAYTMVNSTEFRGLINDFLELVQDVIRKEGEKAPEVKPSEVTAEPLTEEAKRKAEESQKFGKQVLTEIKEGTLPVSEEKKQILIFRFKQLIRKLSADPNYRNAVNGIWQFTEQVQYYAKLMQERASTVDFQNTAMWRMWVDAKSFISNFTGEEVLNKFNNDTYSFYQLFMNDQQMLDFFRDFKNLVFETLDRPEILDTDEIEVRFNELSFRARSLINDPRYNEKYNLIYDDGRFFINKFRTDITSQKLTEDFSRLAHDLALDPTGKPNLQIMASGLNQLRSLLAPILRKNLENVSVPTFSGSNETYDWTIESMILNASEIVPDYIESKMWGRAVIPLTTEPAKAETYLTVWIRNVGLEAKDIKFHFDRKTFPKIEEKGIADVSIASKGTELRITWKVEGDQNTNWNFSVHNVKCTLGSCDIYIKESTHTYLMKFLTTLFSGSIRQNIEDQIEESVKSGMGVLNDQLNATLRTAAETIQHQINI